MRENSVGRTGANRRDSVRVPQHYMLNFRPLSSTVKSEWDISSTRNLSKRGVLFYGAKPFFTGTLLEMKIRTPSSAEGQICQARVIRCEPILNQSNLFAIAVNITLFDNHTKAVIHQTIDEYTKNKKVFI